MELNVIKKHLSTIASFCDHANEKDGVGFSKSTATMGHLLNSIDGDDFTQDMVESAEYLLYFHRKQVGLTPKHFTSKPSGKLKDHTAKSVQTSVFLKDGTYRIWTSKKFVNLHALINALAGTTNHLKRVPFPEGEMFEFASKESLGVFFKLYTLALVNSNLTSSKLVEVEGGFELMHYENVAAEISVDGGNFKFTPTDYTSYSHIEMDSINVHDSIGDMVALLSAFLNEGESQELVDSEKLSVNARQTKTKKALYFDFYLTLEDVNRLQTELSESAPRFITEAISSNHYVLSNTFAECTVKACDFSYKGIEKLAELLGLELDLTNSKPKDYLHLIEQEHKKQQRYIEFVSGNRLHIYFPYSPVLVSVAKSCKNRSFVGGAAPYWQVQVDKDSFLGDKVVVDELMDDFNFTFEQKSEFDDYIAKLEVEAVDNPPAPPTLISLKGEDTILIKFDFSYERLSMVKRLFKSNVREFNRAESTWYIEANKNTKMALVEFKEDGWYFDFDIDSYLSDAQVSAEQEAQNRIKMKRLSKAKKVAKSHAVHKKSLLHNALMKFQYVPVAYSDYSERFFMADDMGTGKTIQSLAIVQHKEYSNTLILCPNIASPTWEKEILKFYPLISEKDILRIKTVDQDFSTEDLKAAKFTIVHYDIVYKLHARLTECKIFDAIIADESHKIKNKDSQRSKAAFVFAEVHEPKGRFLLSGSITTGRPKDLIAQLEFLGLLESEFGGFLEFTARYCNGHRNEYGYWEYSGASNLPELYEKLASCCMVRRKKTDVLKDLPTKMRSCVAVELSNAAEYKALESEAVNTLAAEFQEAAEVAAKKRKGKLKGEELEQFDEAAYTKSVIQAKLENYHAGGALSQVGLLKSIAARGKIKPAVEWIKNYLDNDVRAPLVVFPNSRQAQKEIYKKVSQLKEVNVLQITANHSPDERAAIIEDFQTGQCDVLVASLKATNTNVTLTAASTCLFPDLTDEADNFVQAEDRILRIGSTGDSVECVYLKADETIDDDVWERHISKVSNMALVQDGKISKEFDMRALASPYTRKLIQRVSKVLEAEY